MTSAVLEAYRDLLMHGEYPLVATFIDTDPGQVDVNIHPTKSQVKFENQSNAFRAVKASIREVLETAPWLERDQSKVMASESAQLISREGKHDLESDLGSNQETGRGPFSLSTESLNFQFRDSALKSGLNTKKKKFQTRDPFLRQGLQPEL